MIFTKETHKIIFKDKYITKGCAIQNADRQMYLLVEDDDEKIKSGILPEYRFVYTYAHIEDPKERYFATGRTHLSYPKIAYSQFDKDIIGLDIRGQLYSEDMDGDREEKSLPRKLKDTLFSRLYTNLKTIGESMYAVGEPRTLVKRVGVDDWQNLSDSIPITGAYLAGLENDEEFGWNDVDGFSEQDMYLAGEEGDVWHYNGSDFKQCDFPSNETLENVCCADDDFVYIGGRMGRLWKGKADTWELVSDAEFSVYWKDIVWFKGRLFLGSDYGLWEFKDGEVIRAEVPDQVLTCSGALSICPEKIYLLTAGNNGASMYDGKEWTVLFDQFDLPD